MKPAITTITLLVANVLLIGYILIIDRYKDDTETRLSESVRLANFDREAVAKVMLKTAEGEAEMQVIGVVKAQSSEIAFPSNMMPLTPLFGIKLEDAEQQTFLLNLHQSK